MANLMIPSVYSMLCNLCKDDTCQLRLRNLVNVSFQLGLLKLSMATQLVPTDATVHTCLLIFVVRFLCDELECDAVEQSQAFQYWLHQHQTPEY